MLQFGSRQNSRGLALGIVSMGNMGNAVAAMTLPYISKAAGFDSVYYFLIILTVIFGVLLQSFVRKCRLIKSKTIKGALSVAADSGTWYLSLFYFLTFSLFVAFTNLTPTFLTGMFHYTPVTAGLYSALFAFVCTLVRPFGGYLADRKRPMALLQWVFVAIVIFAIWIMLSFSQSIHVYRRDCLVGLSAGISNGLSSKWFHMYLKKVIQGGYWFCWSCWWPRRILPATNYWLYLPMDRQL